MTLAVILFLLSLVALGTFVYFLIKGLAHAAKHSVTGKQIAKWFFGEAALFITAGLLFLGSVISGGFALVGWVLSFF